MKLTLAVLLVCALAITRGFSHSLEKRQLNAPAAAAAADGRDCNCQCSSYAYVDRYGKTQGNCKTAYQGRLWCYLDTSYTECLDNQIGTGSGISREWSYQACATPARSSFECINAPTPCRPGGFC